ncbi:probable glutamate receptor [Biomphalaria glabrata]|uniref:Probable glutamate receptor n=1 Tax=Biomphalaria glabrata TaxID=6526 RepID=A0A9W2YZS2_BIOGL|nr:probable glutamate receptor [Biomphalaria glabrata]XP_055868245.1 probable glutamate receptor [Biomphalaria glabrata]KAI8751616.1 glutamate receptor 2-like [Biomphalaria glabrata]
MDTRHWSVLLLHFAVLLTEIHTETTKPDTPTPPPNTTTTTVTTTTGSSTTAGPKKLIAITLLDPPFVMHEDRGTRFTGLAIEVFREIVQQTGYDNFDLKLPNDAEKYNWEESLLQINDLVGRLRSNEADVAIGAFTLTPNLASEVQVSQPILHTGYKLLYKIPDSWHPGEAMVTLLRPFSPGLWVLIIFMTVITSLVLYAIGRFSPYEDIAFVGKTSTYEGLNVPNSFLYTYSTLMWQGYTAAPKSFSGRVLVCIWWLFSIMTLASYIAALSVLLFRVPEIRTLPFSNMDEFCRQNKVDMLIVANSSSFNYLSNSKRLLERRLYQKLKPENVFVGDIDKAVKKMMAADGKLALFLESSIAQYLATQDPCDKMVIGERLGDHSIGFICQKNSTVCDKLNVGILKMQEDEKIDVLKKKYFQGGCLAGKGRSYIFEGLPFFDTFGGEPDAIMPMSITITRFSSAFIILTLGIVIAGVLLVIEIYWSKKRGSPVPQRINRGGIDDDTERIRNEYRDEVERA